MSWAYWIWPNNENFKMKPISFTNNNRKLPIDRKQNIHHIESSQRTKSTAYSSYSLTLLE